MKCEVCEGRGFLEYNAGLLQVQCTNCDGVGEVEKLTLKHLETAIKTIKENGSVAHFRPPIEARELDYSNTRVIGILLRLSGEGITKYSDDELWQETKEKALKTIVFPYEIKMPCGKCYVISLPEIIMDSPIENIMCPCGNPNHYIVKFEDGREADDYNYTGNGQSVNSAGSSDSSQPKQPGKPKKRRKATKRTRKLLPKA